MFAVKVFLEYSTEWITVPRWEILLYPRTFVGKKPASVTNFPNTPSILAGCSMGKEPDDVVGGKFTSYGLLS